MAKQGKAPQKTKIHKALKTSNAAKMAKASKTAKASKAPFIRGTPWKTDQWFVSPWNYEPEVVKDFKFPPSTDIKIHDITLRDGEQQAGIAYSLEDKVKIAKALAEVGVHRIEAGMPAVSKVDEAAVKEIVQADLGPEIFAFSRCMASDVKLAKECGVRGIVVEIPSSEHVIKYAYGWELQKAIDLSIEATLLAKELGLYTVWFPIDASRADMGWFLDLIEKISTEARNVLNAKGKVELQIFFKPVLLRVGQDAVSQLLGVRGTHDGQILQGLQLSMDPYTRRRVRGDVEVGASRIHHAL